MRFLTYSSGKLGTKPLKPRTPEEIARDAEAKDVAEWMEANAGKTDSFSSLGTAFDGLKL